MSKKKNKKRKIKNQKKNQKKKQKKSDKQKRKRIKRQTPRHLNTTKNVFAIFYFVIGAFFTTIMILIFLGILIV